MPPTPNKKSNNNAVSMAVGMRQRRKIINKKEEVTNKKSKKTSGVKKKISPTKINSKSNIKNTTTTNSNNSISKNAHKEVEFIFWLFLLTTCMKLLLLYPTLGNTAAPAPATDGTCSTQSASPEATMECANPIIDEDADDNESGNTAVTMFFHQLVYNGDVIPMIISDAIFWYGAYFASISFHYYSHSNDQKGSIINKISAKLSKKSTKYNTMVSFILIVLNPAMIMTTTSTAPHSIVTTIDKIVLGILLVSLGYIMKDNDVVIMGANNYTSTHSSSYYPYIGTAIYGLLLSLKGILITSASSPTSSLSLLPLPPLLLLDTSNLDSYHSVIVSLGPIYFCYLLERYCLSAATTTDTDNKLKDSTGNKNGVDQTDSTLASSYKNPEEGKTFLVLPFASLTSILLFSMTVPHIILLTLEKQLQNHQAFLFYNFDDIDWKLDVIQPALHRSLVLPFFNVGNEDYPTRATTTIATTSVAVAEPNNIWMIYKLIQKSVTYIQSCFGMSSFNTTVSILPNVTPFVCNSLLFITMLPAIQMASLKLTNIKLLQGVAYTMFCVYMLAYNHDDYGGNNYHEMAMVTCMSVMALLVVGRQKRIPTMTKTTPIKQNESRQRRLAQQTPIPQEITSLSTMIQQQQQQQRHRQLQISDLQNQQYNHRNHDEHSMLMDLHNLLHFQTAAWGVISLLFPLNVEEEENPSTPDGSSSNYAIMNNKGGMIVKLVVYGTYLALVSHVLRTPPKWMSTAIHYMTISQVIVAFVLMEFVVPFLKSYFGTNDSSGIINSIHDEFIPLLLASISCTGGLIGCWVLSFWVLCRHHDHDL